MVIKQYDELGWIIKQILLKLDGFVIIFYYDKKSNLIKKQDWFGKIIEYMYNSDNMFIGFKGLDILVLYMYDEMGCRMLMMDDYGKMIYLYCDMDGVFSGFVFLDGIQLEYENNIQQWLGYMFIDVNG